MKKNNIIYPLLLSVTIFLSCERDKESEGVSRVTDYVSFELQGGDVYLLPQGQAFTEPGFIATEGETDKTSEVTVEGEIDQNTIGLYTVSYSAVNKDGFSSSVDRTVFVYDPAAPTVDFTGSYISSVNRTDLNLIAPDEAYEDIEVLVNLVAPGIFEFSDLLGGFYADGRGFGANYRAHGFLKLNSDNTLEYISSELPGFGDSLDGVENGIYDPVAGIITFSSFYVGGRYQFDVELTPVNE